MPTVQDIRAGGDSGDVVTMLAAYDAPTATIIDAAEVDMILVGDSIGNAVLGYDSTLPVTVDEIASHTGAVVRAVEEALVVADLPFLSVGVTEAEGITNAGRMVKEAGAGAVKIESSPHTVELTERLVQIGIPVMAHVGLTPQHVNRYGGYPRQGTDWEAAEAIRRLAEEHADAGAFAVVLEHIPANVARTITDDLDIPTIGIGAGPATDGQVLVVNDVIGLSDGIPPFAKAFGDVKSVIESAVDGFRDAVQNGEFPEDQHYHVEPELDTPY